MASLLSIYLFLFLAFSFPLPSLSSRSYGVEVNGKEGKQEPILQLRNLTQGIGFDPSRVFQLSWHPRAFLYKGFLSAEECDHLISLAQGKLQNTSEIGTGRAGPIHTGSQMFLDRGQDEIVARIEHRISTWTFLPKENGEPMRILHYGIKEEFKPHFDFYQDISQSTFSGNGVATVFMFLSNVTQGGEIILPHLQIKGSQSKDTTWSDCAKSEYGIKAIKGNALLLFNLHLNATTDNCSLHGSCPVVKGEKWSATKWIRAKAFDVRKYSISVSSSSSDGEECTDEDDNCPQWAATGECQKNPVFMLGTPDYYGTCRKSCQIC
eukprot:TRINITY_DN5842_c0_g1_i5.p1 TRINITY_DN5842_c0_g1~~TRINITY_DN5842_c0_g1_i5.p1  ORF type:complete len:322 (-),score=53.35 TRINITY_DN5842_c0_g1_i5:422-1387(-)